MKDKHNLKIRKTLMIIIFLLSVHIIITSSALAENVTEQDNRTEEINASATLATIILSTIIFIIFLYFTVDYATKRKHLSTVTNVFPKAKKIVNETEKEEIKKEKEKQEILKKAELRRNLLERKFQKKRNKLKSKNKFNILSEFDHDSDTLNEKEVNEKYKNKNNKNIFLTLEEIGKHKKLKKDKKKLFEKNKDLFDKVEELGKKKKS